MVRYAEILRDSMKICHITITHDVFDTRIFKKECVSLKQSGYQVVLIAPHSKKEVVDGVQILPIFKWESFIERIFSAPKAAIKLAKKVDAELYHFHDPELFPAMISFAKRNGKKVIWDAHENYRDTLYRLNSLKIKPISWLAARWFGWMEINAAKNTLAGIVTITDVMAEKYRKKGVKTCVLANYADISKFNYKGVIDITDKPRLISSGSHFRGRAVKEVAHSFSIIRKEMDAEIVFSGRFTNSELEEEVKSILSETDVEGINWKVEGSVTFDYLINKAIPKAWVGLVLFDISDPNNRNGLPNRFFECWANGLPVIVTRDTQVAKLVKDVNGGIVINDNTPEEIAKAFVAIAKDKKSRNEMSNNAYKAVIDKYNWDKNFQDLKNYYNEILSS